MPEMPADPTPPPTDAELATLTPEERDLYDYFDAGLENQDDAEYRIAAKMLRELMRHRAGTEAQVSSATIKNLLTGMTAVRAERDSYRQQLEELRLAARPRPIKEAPFDVWILCEHIATGDWRRLRRLRGSDMLFDAVGSVGNHFAFPRWMPAPAPPQPEKAVGDE